jgi:hypothetical protein
MAAVGDHILRAPSLAQAQDRVKSFLSKQLDKLTAQAERTGKPTSWALTPETGTGEKTLGQTLIRWIVEEKYLEGKEAPKDLDRLEALRRFWSRVHGLYRYEAEMEQGMPLQHLSEEG